MVYVNVIANHIWFIRANNFNIKRIPNSFFKFFYKNNLEEITSKRLIGAKFNEFLNLIV